MYFKALPLLLMLVSSVEKTAGISNATRSSIFSGIENFATSCEFGWMLIPGYGCFLFELETKVTWMEAQVYCEDNGGHLPEILDDVLEEALVEYTRLIGDGDDGDETVKSWLGATDIGNEGQWIWIHSGKNTSIIGFTRV